MHKFLNLIIRRFAVGIVFTLIVFGQNLNIAAFKQYKKNVLPIDLSKPLKRCWIYPPEIEGQEIEHYASDKVNKILISYETGKLEFFDITTEKPFWSSEFGVKAGSDFVLDDESIYFVITNKSANTTNKESYFLKKISNITGLVEWQTKLPIQPYDINLEGLSDKKVKLSLSTEKVIIAAPDGNIYALDKHTGNEIWRRRINSEPFNHYQISGNRIIVGTSIDSGNRVSIISTEGLLLKEISTKEKMPTASLFVRDRFVFGDRNGTIYALNSLNNSYAWKFRTGGEIVDITESEAGLLVSSKDNFIYLINPSKGKLIWRSRLPGRIFGKPLISGRYAIAASIAEPQADVIDLKNGKILNRILVEKDDYLTGSIFLQNNLLLLSTLKGLNAYSSDNCS